MHQSPYEILGISKEASPLEIKRAYHKLALFYHPDRNTHKSPEEKKKCEEKFKEINSAYTKLTSQSSYSFEEQSAFSSFKEKIGSFFDSFQDNSDSLFSNVMYDIRNFTNYYSRNSKKKDIAPTCYYNIHCNLIDIYNGLVKTLDIDVERKCSKCLGLGKNLINQTDLCCSSCKGHGLITKNESLVLYLDRKQQTFEKKGNETLHQTRGTIQVNIFSKDHDSFQNYRNYDLITHVSYTTLVKNNFKVIHITNEELSVPFFKEDEVNEKPYKIKIENKGLLYPVGYEKERGDLWIFII